MSRILLLKTIIADGESNHVNNQRSLLFDRCDRASSSPASRPEKCWMNRHLTRKLSRLRLLPRPITPSSPRPTQPSLRPSLALSQPFRSQLLLRQQAPRSRRAPSRLLVPRASPSTRPPVGFLQRQGPLSPRATSLQRQAAEERPARGGSTRTAARFTRRKITAQDSSRRLPAQPQTPSGQPSCEPKRRSPALGPASQPSGARSDTSASPRRRRQPPRTDRHIREQGHRE